MKGGIKMIGSDFIASTLQQATYKLKEGTKSSYYWQSGTRILPDRLSISKESEMTKVARKGRNLLHSLAGQMVGTFKMNEESPLKQFKPFTCRTQIWAVDEYPLFIGYGTTGITNEEGGVTDTGDLVVFYSTDNWSTIQISFFRGLGNPDYLLDCMEYLNNSLK
jgi:hypothetical protein